jgi:RND superfamily putative drug exporter
VGTTIGLGLLFDTLIVRSFMMPSVAALLGRWFWWPLNVREHPARAPHAAEAVAAAEDNAEVDGAENDDADGDAASAETADEVVSAADEPAEEQDRMFEDMVATAFPELSGLPATTLEDHPTEVLATVQPPEEESDR